MTSLWSPRGVGAARSGHTSVMGRGPRVKSSWQQATPQLGRMSSLSLAESSGERRVTSEWRKRWKMARKKCEWPTMTMTSCGQYWICVISSEVRSATAALVSCPPMTHHGSSASVVVSGTPLSASSASLSAVTRASCESARLPHSSPVAMPTVSRDMTPFFFSRALGFSSIGRPEASSSGCSATYAVCSARVSGEAQTALADCSARRAAASAGDEENSPLGSSRAAAMAARKLDACW
mmetsp:Transcript_45210/g.125378  ORF Transcript_45210/g.125378 Transcript_45210/m.125378 type:complete len:237 (+) Transcript_45210:833-1543(+)